MMLTVKDLQSMLKIGRDTAYALMHSSTFPSIKLGGRYYVTEDALNKWLTKVENKTILL
jgi:excisionase family DNA binding protein